MKHFHRSKPKEELLKHVKAIDMEKKPWKGRLCRKLTVKASKNGELGDKRKLEGGWTNLQERVSSVLEKKLNWKLDNVLKIL